MRLEHNCLSGTLCLDVLAPVYYSKTRKTFISKTYETSKVANFFSIVFVLAEDSTSTMGSHANSSNWGHSRHRFQAHGLSKLIEAPLLDGKPLVVGSACSSRRFDARFKIASRCRLINPGLKAMFKPIL